MWQLRLQPLLLSSGLTARPSLQQLLCQLKSNIQHTCRLELAWQQQLLLPEVGFTASHIQLQQLMQRLRPLQPSFQWP